MKQYLIIVSLFSLVTISATMAQEPWSLQKCINYAQANNLTVKHAQLEAEIARNNELQARMNILPNLNGNLGYDTRWGKQVDPFTNEFLPENSQTKNANVNFSSNLNLFNGLQLYNNIKLSQYQTLSSLQQVEQEKIDIAFEIATSYLNILFKDELLQVAKSQIEVTEMQIERTRKLVEAGSSAKGDLLEIQAQLANERLTLTESENALKLANINLAQLLDIDSVHNFEVVFPDSVNPDMSIVLLSAEVVYEEALYSLPQIKTAEFNRKIALQNLAINKGQLSPQLYAGVGWGTGYSSTLSDNTGLDFNDQMTGNTNTRLFVGASIPIFNRWRVATDVSNAKVRLSEADNGLALIKQQLFKEIQQAYNDAISAKAKYISAQEAVISFKEAFKYTEQKRDVGLINMVDYSVSKNNLIKAQSELLQAKYQYVFALKILDYYRGVPLSL